MYYLRNFDKQADAVGQKAYLPTIAIVGGVNKVGYFDGDASKESVFSEDGDFIKTGEKETRVVCTYNVSSTTGATQLLFTGLTLSNIASMEVDGVNTTVATGYTFTSTGEHTVKFTFKDNTMITAEAFADCTSLTSVIIPDSFMYILNGAFSGCTSLTSITIPDSVTAMGYSAFTRCTSLTSVTISDSVTTIYNSAFLDCTSLISVTIGTGLTSINALFSDCTSLTSVTIGNSVTSIGRHSFYNCSSLTSITIPDSVTSIGDCAFSGCTSLTSVTIPDSVTSIGDSAFQGCSGLTSITIGSGVTKISDEVFWYCDSLATINYTGTIAQWKAIDRTRGWHISVPATKVTCSDGECGLDETTTTA